MVCRSYDDSSAFLKRVEPIFSSNEPLYGLIHAISLSLVENLNRFGSSPFFATVEEQDDIRLIALMTPPHKLQLASLCEEPKAPISCLATALAAEMWSVPAVMGEKVAVEAFAEIWGGTTGVEARQGMEQRLMICRKVSQHKSASGSYRQACREDLGLIGHWTTAFYREAFPDTCSDQLIVAGLARLQEDEFYLWLDPEPVGVACYSRPTLRGVSVSLVYTPPECRGKGYASALVAAMTQRALEQGREYCSLYTDLANPTSNHIYEKIGYHKVADLTDIDFTPLSHTL